MRHQHNSAIPIVLLSVLMGFSVACSKHASDETISKDIQSKVSADPDTKDSQVNVAAKDGKVTLTGNVSSPAAQQKLEQIPREEPGAVGADDQTAAQPGTQAMQAAAPAPPPVEAPKPEPVVVPAGTVLT